MIHYPPSIFSPDTYRPRFLASDFNLQFRMHSSERSDVYLSAAATPVIEKCTGICFSEYPASLRASADKPKDVSHHIS